MPGAIGVQAGVVDGGGEAQAPGGELLELGVACLDGAACVDPVLPGGLGVGQREGCELGVGRRLSDEDQGGEGVAGGGRGTVLSSRLGSGEVGEVVEL